MNIPIPQQSSSSTSPDSNIIGQIDSSSRHWSELRKLPLSTAEELALIEDFSTRTQIKPTNLDTREMRKAMRGLSYGTNLKQALNSPGGIHFYSHFSNVQIHPFAYLEDLSTPQIKASCIELCYYLLQRLKVCQEQASFSEPYNFVAVRGKCTKYFNNTGSTHMYVIAWKEKDERAARAALHQLIRTDSPINAPELLILDPSFRAICSLSARSNYRVGQVLLEIKNLPTYHPDYKTLDFVNSIDLNTDYIPLGFMRNFVSKAHFPGDLSKKALVSFAVIRGGVGNASYYKPLLGIQNSAKDRLKAWDPEPSNKEDLVETKQARFIANLPAKNLLRRFYKEAERQLAEFIQLPKYVDDNQCLCCARRPSDAL